MINTFRTALLVLIAAIPVSAISQTIVSPNDPIYSYLHIWEQRGLIDWLPPLRPLPAPIIHSSLSQVAGLEHTTDHKIAQRLLKRYFGGPPVWGQGHLIRRSKDTVNSSDTEKAKTASTQTVIQLAASAEAPIGDQVGFGFTARTLATSIESETTAPLLLYDPYDPIAPGIETTLLGGNFQVRVELSGNAYLGSTALSTLPGKWYVQAGFGRSSFGFNKDSSIVSASAQPAGYLSGTYRGDRIAYSALFLDLIAEYGICSSNTIQQGFCDTEGAVYSLTGRAKNQKNYYPSKFLSTQSLSFYPINWLELTVMQSVIFGGRLSPIYLLPAFPSLYTQIQLGDYDNSFIGAAVRFRFPYGVSAKAIFYVDDINFMKMRQFDFNSAQNKLAMDLEVGITPPLPILTILEARYRMVTPYMYAHHPSALDYLQYTHDGLPLGSQLDPNSEEIKLTAYAFPADWLAAELSVRRVRHGGPNGGSIWDHGLVDGVFVFTGPSTYLKQETLENLLQARAGIDISVDVNPVELTFGIAYTYEQMHNRDLVKGDDDQAHLVELSTSVRY